MKTKTISLYSYDELAPKAKEKALTNWQTTNELPFLESHLENLTKEMLEEKGYKAEDDRVSVSYDLSYSQGSHFYFTGSIMKNGVTYKIEQQGAGYATYITFTNDQGEEEDAPQTVFTDVEEINTAMKEKGYNEMEYQNSEEVFREECEANDYTFREDGTLESE